MVQNHITRHYLVIQTAFLGDVILSTPLLRWLRDRDESSVIHVVTTAAGAAVLNGLPGVVCHVLDKKRGQTLWQKWIHLRQLAEKLHRVSTFDETYLVHRSLRSWILAQCIVSRRRIAFFRDGGWLNPLNLWDKFRGASLVKYPDYADDTHYVDKVLSLAAGTDPNFRTNAAIGISPQPQHRPWLQSSGLLPNELKDQPYIVISPFSVWATKMWPLEKFAQLTSLLANSSVQPRYRVVVIGGNDSPYGDGGFDAVAKCMPDGVLNLVGKTDINQLKTLIAGAKLLISNDSAPIHVAAAFDIPTLAVFGPTVQRLGFFPLSSQNLVVQTRDLDCRPCGLHGHKACPLGHHRCMNDISIDDVYTAALKLLRNKSY